MVVPFTLELGYQVEKHENSQTSEIDTWLVDAIFYAEEGKNLM